MSKKLIGYGYTNNKGIATLDYDADGNPLQTSGYTGTGAGNIDFIAQYHDGTTEFQSEPFAVWDTIKYDLATDTYTDSFWVNPINITRNTVDSSIYKSDGALLLYSSISGDVTVEMDLKSTMNSIGNVLYVVKSGGSSLKTMTLSDLGMTPNDWKHLKFTIKNNKLSVEGTEISNVDVSDYNRFAIRCSQNNTTYFKNVYVYNG